MKALLLMQMTVGCLYSQSVFSPVNMTNYSVPSPYVVNLNGASIFGGGFEGWQVFTNPTNGTYYYSGFNTVTLNLDLDLGAGNKYKLTSYTLLMSAGDVPNSSPKNWAVQGSNDNTTWTVVDTQTNVTSWVAGTIKTFTVTGSPASYRYYRFAVSAQVSSAYMSIGKISYIGVQPRGSSSADIF